MTHNTFQESSHSRPAKPAAAAPTARFWGLIILPSAPPLTFAEAKQNFAHAGLVRGGDLQQAERRTGGRVRIGYRGPNHPASATGIAISPK
jgi:hypothetical protein